MEIYQENIKLKQELENLKQKTLDVEGIKGESGTEFVRKDDVWIVKEYRREDRAGRIKPIVNKIAHRDVQILWKIIKHHCPEVGDKTKYKILVPTLLKVHKLHDITVEGFNGGKNRKHYFRVYQYPSKILHKLVYVHYTLKGEFIRLR